MAWTSEDLTKIEEAIASGALSVKYADKMVTYQSLDSMLRVRDLIRRELGLTDPSQSRILAKFKKGLDG